MYYLKKKIPGRPFCAWWWRYGLAPSWQHSRHSLCSERTLPSQTFPLQRSFQSHTYPLSSTPCWSFSLCFFLSFFFGEFFFPTTLPQKMWRYQSKFINNYKLLIWSILWQLIELLFVLVLVNGEIWNGMK